MKKRDLLFYLAVFGMLAVSAATVATVNRVSALQGEIEALTIRADLQDQRIEQMAGKLEDALAKRVSEELELESVVARQVKSDAANQLAWMPAGEFRIYHYCSCEYCTGKKPGDPAYGITKTGTTATAGRTIAVDPDVIPLGSEVLINGVIYIAEDTGVKGKTIDLFVDSHEQAIAMGTCLTAVSWR